MPALRFPGDLNVESFLAEYWQKKPLLMRAAVNPKRFELSPDEVAGLAMEPDVEARLVFRQPKNGSRVAESPFARTDLTELSSHDWTLLVNDVDKHLPELASFLDLFGFIPSWRLDDLMVSVAAPGGGVGPHVDQYDVFLCQMLGHRRWKIGNAGDYVSVDVHGLQQLESFDVTENMVMGPGDVLYLPPGIPHDGVAEDLCSTWSVGFRASTADELATGMGLDPAEPCNASARYADPDLQTCESQAGLIGPQAITRFKKLLGNPCCEQGEFVTRLGKFLTTQKKWLVPDSSAAPLTPFETGKVMASGETLCRHGMALFARAETTSGQLLFASGKAHSVAGSAAELAPLICSQREITRDDLEDTLQVESVTELLAALYNDGQLLLASEWESDDNLSS